MPNQVLHHQLGTVEFIVIGAGDHAAVINAGNHIPVGIRNCLAAHVFIRFRRIIHRRSGDADLLPLQVAHDRNRMVGRLCIGARDAPLFIFRGDQVACRIVVIIRAQVFPRPAAAALGDHFRFDRSHQIANHSFDTPGLVIVSARDISIGIFAGNLVPAHIVVVASGQVVQILIVLRAARGIILNYGGQPPGSVILAVRHQPGRVSLPRRSEDLRYPAKIIKLIFRGQVVETGFILAMSRIIIDNDFGLLPVFIVFVPGHLPAGVGNRLEQPCQWSFGVIMIACGLPTGGNALQQVPFVLIGGCVVAWVRDDMRLVVDVGDGCQVPSCIREAG